MSSTNNRGVALVITLLVLTLLLTIILDFNLGMRVEARSAANFRDDLKAYYLARSGITFAIALLEEDGRTEPDYDSLNELWAQKIPLIPVGDGFISVEITDESSKINANKLATGLAGVTGENMRSTMVRFLKQFKIEDDAAKTIADSIADWIDLDDRILEHGAESNYYEGLEDPYKAKDKPLYSLQELRLIKDMEGDAFARLRNFLTVFSDGLININTASKEVLISLSEDITEATANEIITIRADAPFTEPTNIEPLSSLSAEEKLKIARLINVSSNYFSITSAGEVNHNRKTIHAVVKREVMGNEGETRDVEVGILYWHVE